MIINKPGISKGGQIVLLCDQYGICLHAYAHHHKLWDWPTDFTEGTNEERIVIIKLDDMIIAEGDKQVKKIFMNRPTIKWDKYLSQNTIFDYAGGNGFGLLVTVRQDMLPKGVLPQYLCKKPTDPGNLSAKCACYNKQIVMVMNKEDPVTYKKHQK
eukprot:3418435-Ditylum_brightwellii.AAC.1